MYSACVYDPALHAGREVLTDLWLFGGAKETLTRVEWRVVFCCTEIKRRFSGGLEHVQIIDTRSLLATYSKFSQIPGAHLLCTKGRWGRNLSVHSAFSTLTLDTN